MADKICCVPDCGKSRSDDVTLHMFPHPDDDADRFKTWLYTIGGDILKLDNQKILKYRKVCSLHFERKYQTFTRSKRLTANAVPSLKLPGSTVKRNPLREIVNQGTNYPQLKPSTSAAVFINFQESENIPLIDEVKTQQPVTSAISRKRIATRDANEPCKSTQVQPSTFCGAAEVFASQKGGTRQATSSAGTKRKQKLSLVHSSETSLLKRKINSLQNANKNYSSRLKRALNLAQNSTFIRALKKFSAFAVIFTLMQFREINKKKMGRRFSKKEKVMALALYKQGPKAYRWLRHIFVLPAPLTLSRLLSTANLTPGVNNNIYENLKKRVKKMEASEKLCILVFDEMAIAPNFNYNRKRDEVVGFATDGKNKDNKIADHALVFMIRGIIKNYKQAVSYSFCSGSTHKIALVNQIKEIITKLQETGLKVMATVCDQGAANKSAINYLIRGTQEKYSREDKHWNKNTFEINDEEVVPLFDAPHLIKGIRNNLITKDLMYVKNGDRKVAKWEHLINLHKENPAFMGLRMLPKLTDEHVIPNKIKKMKVKCATQVFSKSVAVAMGYLVEKGILPGEAKDTAEVLIFFDDLFDSVNGSYKNSKKRSGKTLLQALTPNSYHKQLWDEAKILLKTMKYVTKSGSNCIVPSISNWILTLENIEYLANKLFSEHQCKSLWMRHFNQDPLENFFGCVRSHGARNINPTSAGFECSFAALLINNLNSLHSASSNCEKDMCSDSMFKSLSKLFFKNVSVRPPIEIDFNHLNADHIILNFKSKITDIKVKAQISYVTGYVVKKLKKIFKNCRLCNDCFCTADKNEALDYIQLRDYSINNNYLTYPSFEAMECFSNQQDVITFILRDAADIGQIRNYIKTILSTICNYDFIKCTEHKSLVVEEMQDLLCRFFICNWCKDANKILKGIRSDFDVNDKVQKMAHQYHIKRKKNKK